MHLRQACIENLIIAALIAMFLSLTGCTGVLTGNQYGRDNLTAEQIKAYNDQGNKVYMCVQVVGPPPSGAVMHIIVPKDSVYQPRFGDGCRILP